jgi:hypothetical protein
MKEIKMTPEESKRAADEGRRKGRSIATGLPLPAIDLIEEFEQIKATSKGWFDFSVEKDAATSGARITAIFNEASGEASRFGIDVDSTGCVTMDGKSVEDLFHEEDGNGWDDPTANESVALVIRRTAQAVAQRLYLEPKNGKMREMGYSEARQQAEMSAVLKSMRAPRPQ